MKKAVVIIIVVLVACMSVSAADISMGVMQNFMDTSFIVDAQFGRFGVEGAVGIPLVWGTAGIIDSVSKGQQVTIGDAAAMLLLPGAMVNGYWKALDGRVIDLRIGIQADVIGLISDNLKSIVGLWGISAGLDFKFGERFSANITGTLPAALPLSLISDDAAKFGAFYYTWGSNNDPADILVIIFGQLLPGALSEIARVSFKWTV